jgi:hypothetical protein
MTPIGLTGDKGGAKIFDDESRYFFHVVVALFPWFRVLRVHPIQRRNRDDDHRPHPSFPLTRFGSQPTPNGAHIRVCPTLKIST